MEIAPNLHERFWVKVTAVALKNVPMVHRHVFLGEHFFCALGCGRNSGSAGIGSAFPQQKSFYKTYVAMMLLKK